MASWGITAALFKAHKVDIAIAFEDIVREIVLPFRILEISFREPATELPVPVLGTTLEDVANNWGDPRNGGRSHEGIDIFAERGTPVFSATEGYVIRTRFGVRGGENVMVTGPGGINYYYAHFDRVALGIRRGVYVTPDTVLGFVGSTGNASGTSPHLHFGIYPERWEAINPYPFFVDR